MIVLIVFQAGLSALWRVWVFLGAWDDNKLRTCPVIVPSRSSNLDSVSNEVVEMLTSSIGLTQWRRVKDTYMVLSNARAAMMVDKDRDQSALLSALENS